MMEVTTTMTTTMVMMKKKKTTSLLCLLVLFFLLSSLRNISAVPLSRSLQLGNQEPTVLVEANQMVTREMRMRMMEEEIARMDIEKDDYPGSGANNRHDPKSPGRA